MSGVLLETLVASARNRGLVMVRSRVRTTSKRRFGKVGLTDKKGKPVFGMDSEGPIATPDEVEDYLRQLDTRDWGASLESTNWSATRIKPDGRDRPTSTRTKQSRAKTKAKPKLQIRIAKASDSLRLVELIRELDVAIDEQQVKRNLAALERSDCVPLVATLGTQLVGMCGVGQRIAIHRPAPLGRITALVVAKDERGRGIGKMLVEAAEQWMRDRGCNLVEVTSNDRRSEAHAFYRHIGYQRTSIRFAKSL